MQRTEQAVAEVRAAGREPLLAADRLRLDLRAGRRCWCCSAAVLIGLVMANQIARPIGRLIQAAERVRGGDLAVGCPKAATDDEIAGLSRAFNRMTGQLASPAEPS